MDFSREQMSRREGLDGGTYEALDPGLLPRLYVAFSEDAGEPTEVMHNNLRARYRQQEPVVVEAMTAFAELAQQGRDALVAGRPDELHALVDRNFDLRQRICHLPPEHVRMVRTARSVGASAKFAGSGGAIIGVVESADMLRQLSREMSRIGCRVIEPQIG